MILFEKVLVVEKLLVVLLFLWIVYSVGVEVYNNVEGEVNYDWRFHTCYANTLDAVTCSHGNYDSYAPLVFLPSFLFVWGLGFPLWLVFFCLFVIVFTLFGFVLIKESGFYGFLSFFLLTRFLGVVNGSLNQLNWFYNVRTGFLPFYFAVGFSLLLLICWDRLSWLKRGLLFLAIMFSHNYGLWLAAFILLLVFLSKLLKLSIVVLGFVITLFAVAFGFVPDRLLIFIELLGSILLGLSLVKVRNFVLRCQVDHGREQVAPVE